jgi:hypothetical protein
MFIAIGLGVLISFWLRPGSAERLILIYLIILIDALYLNELYSILPKNGDRIPLIRESNTHSSFSYRSTTFSGEPNPA